MFQGLTDGVRSGFTRTDVLNVLGWASDVQYDLGMELLDANDNPVYDLTSYILHGRGEQVMCDCNADISRTLQLSTSYIMNWGVDRVRPFMLLSSGRVPNGPVRFDLGVYIPTTPSQSLGSSSAVYQMTAYDKTWMLNKEVGDSYSVAAGVGYITAVKAAITAAFNGLPTKINIDNTSTAVLPSAMVWPLTESHSYTWLEIINELLAAIGYQKLYADSNGFFCAAPIVARTTQAADILLGSEYSSLSAIDPLYWQQHIIVARDQRSITRDVFGMPNRWVFIQSGLGFTPVIGGGMYQVDNTNIGPSSQNATGQVTYSVQYLNASGQADLQAQGDAIVNKATSLQEIVVFKTAPLPLAGQYDVLQYGDPTLPGADQRRLNAQSWTLPLDGTDMSWSTISANPDYSDWTSDPASQSIDAGNPAVTQPYNIGRTWPGGSAPKPPVLIKH